MVAGQICKDRRNIMCLVGKGDNNITVNGGWSDWQSWEECSASCGQGRQQRHRSCDNPEPDMGKPCLGEDVEYRDCTVRECPASLVVMDHAQGEDCVILLDLSLVEKIAKMRVYKWRHVTLELAQVKFKVCSKYYLLKHSDLDEKYFCIVHVSLTNT
ncbi:SEM5A-like protein [Mya arenaria]|uniref:SEM5A-like protein n=1 Tax=Mya arenaria TaxID=6604 RepID=A0ABY7GBX4_MYAAR|nr:SEM5A-like protein [Mya arenaria]